MTVIEITSRDRRAACQGRLNGYGSDTPSVSPMWADFDRFFDATRNPLVTAGHGRFEVFPAPKDGRPTGRIVAKMEMLMRLIAAATAAGYRKLGTTWIADSNVASLRQMQRIGAKPLHRLSLFRKVVGRRHERAVAGR
jgi:hypothetical protein